MPKHGPIFLLPLLFAATAAAQQNATTMPGLDSLDEHRVASELANRGLDSLLKREFQIAQTPPEQQSALLTLISIRKLADPDARLTAKQRQALLADVTNSMQTALPNIDDPTALMQIGRLLVSSSVDPDVNALEYWGENSRTQNRVRPIIQIVLQIYQQAAARAAAQSDLIAAHLAPNDDAGVKRWQQADDLHSLAIFNQYMVEYDLCLALDKSDPQRIELADKAIADLAPFDAPDTAVQAAVRNRIAKLDMAKGDYQTARQIFATVIDNPKQDIKPAPTVAQQYEARYFTLVCQILAGNPDEAQKNLDGLASWQKSNLDSTQQQGASAAFVMLQYRILSAKADKASDADEKKKENDDAIALLMQLLKDQPQYRSVIFEQVLSRLPADPDLTTLDPLLLQALQQEGEQEYLVPQGQKIDEKAMDRAIAAARELIRRRGQGVDDAVVTRSVYVVPYLLERMGRDKEAAAAFLDFAENFPFQAQDANDALDHATALIAGLRKTDPQDQDSRKLYDRFLPLAIGNPYNRRQFAFEYAVLLQQEQQYKKAIEYFQLVPPDDPHAATARFFMMVALKQRLDDANDKISPADRQQILSQIQSLADQVTKETTAARDAAGATAQEKQADSSRLVRTALIAAALASQEQKDPKRTLELLANFEEQVKGLPEQADLLFEALSLRVNSYMELGQTNQATGALVQMLTTKQGNDGPALVFDLLKKLDADMDRAKAAGDSAQVQQLAQNRAALSGFLVSWAQNNSDPKIKALTPRYKIFDASTQQMAAELTTDPATRKNLLEAALKRYQSLQDPNNPDAMVEFGLGTVDYDLGDYQSAKSVLGSLVVNKRVGMPTVTIQENGLPKVIENTQYWQANFELLRSVLEFAKANPTDGQAQSDLESAKTYLKQLYIQWPQSIGGQKFHADFEKLRSEMIPDFHPATD